MKQLILIITFFITVFSYSNSVSQHTVINTIANFNIYDSGNKFSFDVYSLRTSVPPFFMGNSSYFFKYTLGAFGNAVITNVNPKYTIFSISNSYNQMGSFNYSSGKVAIQVFYNNVGVGEVISNVPGVTTFGERIATINLDILNQAILPDLKWDNINTAIVNPFFQSATMTNNGSYNSPLPVELSSFTSVIDGNNVNLLWTTSMEINSRGFEIERKSSLTEWTKIGFIEGSNNSNVSVNYNYKDKFLSKGNYNYRLKQIDFNGNYEYFDLNADVSIGIPVNYSLSQNFPNPFNPSTTINFSIPENSRIDLKIYDLNGREVRTLINNEFRNADYYSLNVNLAGLSSGVYFYTLTGSNFIETKKMTLIK